MDNNVNKKLEEILASMDKSTLQMGAKSAADLLNSNEGERLKKSIADMDKTKLMQMFSQLDTQKVKSALEKADVSKLSGMSTDEIIKKLNRL